MECSATGGYNRLHTFDYKRGAMTQSVSMRLDEVLNKLDILTKATEWSCAWLIAHAIEQYVQHESWQIEAIQTALNKIKNGNSKFANNEEAVRWLQSWGSDQELKAPVCK
jgi:predicted transcriptional regulator